MIVKCRDNSYKKSQLTEGREYFVLEEKSGGYYKIINDSGFKEDCEIERFTTVIKNEQELNIIEANNMPIGTEFIVKFKDGRIETVHIKTITNENGTKLFLWCDNEEVKTYNALLNSKFIPLERPVSFMEALNSKKKIKVDHYLTRSIYEFNDYMDFNIMCRYLYNFENSEVIKIINEGLWYIKE